MLAMKRSMALIAASCFALGAATSGNAWCAPALDAFDLAAQPRLQVVHSELRKPFQVGSALNPFSAAFLPSIVVMAQMVENASTNASTRQKLSLQDPAPYAKEALAEGLRKGLDLNNLTVSQETMSVAALNALKKQNASGLLLEISTEYWGLEAYRAKYYAEAKLIDFADSSVLWTWSCPAMLSNTVDHKKMQPESDEAARALDELLLADDGALIKAALRDAAERCGGMIARQLLRPKPKPRTRAPSEAPWPGTSR